MPVGAIGSDAEGGGTLMISLPVGLAVRGAGFIVGANDGAFGADAEGGGTLMISNPVGLAVRGAGFIVGV